MQTPYDADYFLRGIETAKGNYQDYRWLEPQTMALASRVIEIMDIRRGDKILDWGCARGFLVKALRRLGVDAWGYDISDWAIANCDPEVKDYVHRNLQHENYDHVFCKDCAEHFDIRELFHVTDHILARTYKTILIMVPLTQWIEGQYIRKEDNMDVTHKIRWPLEEWMSFFQSRIPGESWILTGSWHIPGLKPTSFTHIKSCGFVLMRRIPEPSSPS